MMDMFLHHSYIITLPKALQELQRLTVLPSGPDQRLATDLFGASLEDRLRWLGSFLCTSPMAAYDLKTEDRSGEGLGKPGRSMERKYGGYRVNKD